MHTVTTIGLDIAKSVFQADIDLPRHAKNLALYYSTVEHHEIA